MPANERWDNTLVIINTTYERYVGMYGYHEAEQHCHVFTYGPRHLYFSCDECWNIWMPAACMRIAVGQSVSRPRRGERQPAGMMIWDDDTGWLVIHGSMEAFKRWRGLESKR